MRNNDVVLYSYKKVTCKGKTEGRGWGWKFWPFIKKEVPIQPKTEQEIPAQFETEILQTGESIIAKLSEKWKKEDLKLKTDFCKALKNLLLTRAAYEKEANEANQYLLEHEKIKARFEEFNPPSVNHKWTMFWLILISISEFFINSLVFQILGQNQMETYIAAFGMGIIIPLGAHFFGKSLQQESKSYADKIWLIVVPIAIFALLAGLSFLRSKYFEGLEISKILGIDLSPEEATIVFIIINIALFVIAAVIAHEGTHPQHKLYNTVRIRFRDSLKKLTKEKGEAKEAAKALKEAELSYQEIRSIREKTFERDVQQINQTKETVEWLAAAYRTANLSVRNDLPVCFKKKPADIDIPDTMKKLDWECKEASKEMEQ